MDYISKNDYLTDAEMEVNARTIFKTLRAYNWSKESICAMLGNMESESTINPGIYEGLDSSSSTNGFGLVQWTPNRFFKLWVDEQGSNDYGNLFIQLSRIRYELDNGLQWIETDAYPMSFESFSKSTRDVETLAQAFLYNYERPASLDQPNRSTQARKWYNLLVNENPDTPDTPDTPDEPGQPSSSTRMSKLLFYFAGIRR